MYQLKVWIFELGFAQSVLDYENTLPNVAAFVFFFFFSEQHALG